MAVTHVSTDSGFGDSSSRPVPSGTVGDLLLCIGAGWPRVTNPDPFIDADATRNAAFANVAQVNGPDAGNGDASTIDVDVRTTTGTEPANYTIGLDQSGNSYGGMQALCRITAGQLQASGGGVYTSAGSGDHTVPAHTVDTDGSLAVLIIVGWGSVPNNTTITGQGYTSRASGDSGSIRVYTKSVDAGAVSSFTAGSDGDSTATMLLIFEPFATPSFVGTPTTLSFVSGSGNTIATPTGTVVGESLIAVVRGRIGAVGNGAVTEHFTLTGFSEVVSSVETSGQYKITMLVKVVDADDVEEADAFGGTTGDDLDTDAGWEKVWYGSVQAGEFVYNAGGGVESAGGTGYTWNGSAEVALGYARVGTYPATQFAEVDTDNSGSGGPAVRMQAPGTADAGGGYIGQYGGGLARISRVNADGTTTSLVQSFPTTSAATVRLEASGTTLTLKVDGATVLTTTDAAWSTGRPGIARVPSVGDTDLDNYAGTPPEYVLATTDAGLDPYWAYVWLSRVDEVVSVDQVDGTATEGNTSWTIPTITPTAGGTLAVVAMGPASAGDPPPSPWADIDNVPDGIWVGSIEQAGTAAIGGQSWGGLTYSNTYKGIVANFVSDVGGGGGPIDATDGLGVSDSVATAKTVSSSAADVAGITDSTSAASAAERSAVDPVDLADSSSVAVSAARGAADAVGLADSIALALGHGRSATDDIGTVDAAAAASGVVRAATDAVGVADSVVASLDSPATASATDEVGVADTAAPAKDAAAAATDTIGTADSTTQAKTAAAAADSDIGLTDSAASAKSAPVPATDNVGVADSVSAVKVASASIDDAIGLADDAVTAAQGLREATDAVGVTDGAAGDLAGSGAVSTTDSVAVVDSVLRATAADRTASDQVGVADSAAASAAKAIEITDEVGLSDSTSLVETSGQSATDALGVTDSVAWVLDAVRSIVDGVDLSDDPTWASSALRSATDAIGVTDSTTQVVFSGAAVDYLDIPNRAEIGEHLGHRVKLDENLVQRAALGFDMRREMKLVSTTAESVPVVIWTPADPTGATPGFSLSKGGTFDAGNWDSDGWDSVSGRVVAWSPNIGDGATLDVAAGQNYDLFVRWTVGAQSPTKRAGLLEVS